MGFKWLAFLFGPLKLIGINFGEDQRANIINTWFQKKYGLYLQISVTTLHSIITIIK